MVLAAGLSLVSPGETFQLIWTHSVEKVEWREDWRIRDGRLILEQASVAGSGAGMEPPPQAVFLNGRYTWWPGTVVEELVLARSDFTRDWRFCVEGECRALPAAENGVTRLSACH
jgi:hypothetical protein